ncbi:MAG TPA: hypothetical protein VFX95_00145, partial [Caulobacteraceae bacterium]|nr:hypothetical protein [Caulobacteraceae bacterium]
MLTIADVLAAQDVTRVREGLGVASFGDGKRTAGGAAKKVKANTQADRGDARVQALAKFVRDALARHPVFSLY